VEGGGEGRRRKVVEGRRRGEGGEGKEGRTEAGFIRGNNGCYCYCDYMTNSTAQYDTIQYNTP
jgi:hypothetical protein